MVLENERDILIALRQDVKHLQEVVDDLATNQKTCNLDHENRIKEIEIFKAEIVATGVANEKAVTDTARRTATFWALVIAICTFVITVAIDIWLEVRV